MKNRPLVLAIVVAVLAAAAALLLRAWRLLSAPRTETEYLGAPAAPGTDNASPSSRAQQDERSSGINVQTKEGGVGDLLHRRYEISVLCAMDRKTLLRTIQRNITTLSPAALAEFEKSSGSANEMAVDDEYHISMLGPWNGRVRVSEMTEDSFTLVTLDGHPEAGHITFSVLDEVDMPGSLRVRIDSLARARDHTVNLAYDSLGVGKQVQTEVWVTFLQRVGELAGATESLDVRVTTERHEDEPTPHGGSRD